MADNNILHGNAQTLREILEKYEQLEKTVGEVELLESKLRGIERDIDVIDKTVSEQTDASIRKQRDAILSKYGKEISKEEDKLKKARTDRERALTKGKEERMMEETAELQENNKKLKAEIKTITRENNLSGICKTRLFLALFAAKGLADKLTFVLLFVIFTCVLPYLVYVFLPLEGELVLAGVYCAFWIVFSFSYLAINNTIKVNKWEAIKNIRACKHNIAQNKKHIQSIRTAIHKEDNDSMYNLGEFDNRISEAEGEIKRLTDIQNKDLDEFDNVTAKAIATEIAAGTKTERENLDKLQKETKAIIDNKKAVMQQAKMLLARYEPYLDKKLMNRESLSALIRIIEAGNATDISQAVAFLEKKE
ncbi:MAG: hypothetical protein IJW18_09440 [Lachnospiraceae bacterium]|nr:hypothetical protein [Lachnospiraceae bacterium]